MKPQPAPSSIEDAVACLLAQVPLEQQRVLAGLSEKRLPETHSGLGVWVRNSMWLWSGNDELFEDTGAADPNEASEVIIRAFWARLRQHQSRRSHPTVLTEGLAGGDRMLPAA